MPRRHRKNRNNNRKTHQQTAAVETPVVNDTPAQGGFVRNGIFNVGNYFVNKYTAARELVANGLSTARTFVTNGFSATSTFISNGVSATTNFVTSSFSTAGNFVFTNYSSTRRLIVDGFFNSATFITSQYSRAVKGMSDNLLLQRMRSHVEQIVANNARKVTKLVKNGGSLLQVFVLTAPAEVQRAVNTVFQNREVMDLLQKDQELLTLLGTENIEQGMLQLTSGNTENAVSTISQSNQLAALGRIVDLLNNSKNIKTEDVVLASRFLGTVIKGIQDLQEGKKQYASFFTQNGVTHVSLHDFLTDPTTVARIYASLLERGETGGLQMKFTSTAEASVISYFANEIDTDTLTKRIESISQEDLPTLTEGNKDSALVKDLNTLRQLKSLPEIAAYIAESGNVNSLVEVLGITAPEFEEKLVKFVEELDANSENKPTEGFTEPQIITLMEHMATMIFTGQDIGNRIVKGEGPIGDFVRSDKFTSLPILGKTVMLMDHRVSNLDEQQLLLGVIPGSVPLIDEQREEQLAITFPIEKSETPEIVKKEPIVLPLITGPAIEEINDAELDLTEYKKKYLTLVDNVRLIALDLHKKQLKNEKYTTVAQAALDLYLNLKGASVFFDSPTPASFATFKEFCYDSIKLAEIEFKQHRDVWNSIHPVFKGFLGVIATLTIIPALVVAYATKQGYIDTFFSTPETASAKKLAGVAQELDTIEDEIQTISATPR